MVRYVFVLSCVPDISYAYVHVSRAKQLVIIQQTRYQGPRDFSFERRKQLPPNGKSGNVIDNCEALLCGDSGGTAQKNLKRIKNSIGVVSNAC